MNRVHSSGSDRWLTPPALLGALGPFDLDPCCEAVMPWRTAREMWSLDSPTSHRCKRCWQRWSRITDPDGLAGTWNIAGPVEDPECGCSAQRYAPDASVEGWDGAWFDGGEGVHADVAGQDGLAREWRGRVFVNPPYSDVLPWARRMAEHDDGVMLVSAKSMDAGWAQEALAACSEAYFMRGRLLFHFPDGRRSKGKWLSNLLLSFGPNRQLAGLGRLGFPGVRMVPVAGGAPPR